MFIDRTGHRYGRWKVMRQGDPVIANNRKVRTMWTCVCDCGVVRDVDASLLRQGKSRSCGCLRRDLLMGNQLWKLRDPEKCRARTIWGMRQAARREFEAICQS